MTSERVQEGFDVFIHDGDKALARCGKSSPAESLRLSSMWKMLATLSFRFLL